MFPVLNFMGFDPTASDDDPVAEAELYLAYGHRDKALAHLQKALERERGLIARERLQVAIKNLSAGKALDAPDPTSVDDAETLVRRMAALSQPSRQQLVLLLDHLLALEGNKGSSR